MCLLLATVVSDDVENVSLILAVVLIVESIARMLTIFTYSVGYRPEWGLLDFRSWWVVSKCIQTWRDTKSFPNEIALSQFTFWAFGSFYILYLHTLFTHPWHDPDPLGMTDLDSRRCQQWLWRLIVMVCRESKGTTLIVTLFFSVSRFRVAVNTPSLGTYKGILYLIRFRLLSWFGSCWSVRVATPMLFV